MASLVVGQTIKVRGPKGAMVYTPNMVRAFAMIAGGTGITPMLQIIRAVIRGRPTGDVTKIDLIFANVNQEDILLKEDLDHLASKDENFNVYYVLNNPPEKWDGGVGFVTPEMMTVCPLSLSRLPFPRVSPVISGIHKLMVHRNGYQSPHPTSSSLSAVLHL